jgi:Domain of unknown function (DUF222)/HNH endonuclease
MCTDGNVRCDSAQEALFMVGAGLDYLNSPASDDLSAAALGELLAGLGEVQGKLASVRSVSLRRFGALKGHDADGYGSSSAWLAAMAKMSKRDARAAVRQMHQLGRHPNLEDGLARGEVSESWAREIAEWLRHLPEELRAGTEKVLAGAAAAGASLEDLATITAHALRQWQADHPDPDDEGDFPDRSLKVATTFGGAGVIRGDLTPECAAAVTAVLQALGKKAGPEDDRTEAQRFHDALQLACELLLRARLVPGRAGADTQVVAHIPLSHLRQMPGAAGLEDAWIRALLGEDGYLTGDDARAAACDVMTVPAVTGQVDPSVIDQIIGFVLAAFGHAAPAVPAGPAPAGPAPAGPAPAGPAPAGPGPDGPAPDVPPAAPAEAAGLSPGALRALRHGIARLAIDLVSGPDGIAATLRTGLLSHPWNTPSLPLDIGYSDTIPAHIRRAVQLRDRHCAWPRCRRPLAWCDVHHIVHKKDGGKTSVSDCVLLCQYHHDVCIHRWGWDIELLPDGSTRATSPQGQVLRSHGPPAAQAA